MALAMTRSEQWALATTLLVILGSLALQNWQARRQPGVAYVEGQGQWQMLTLLEANVSDGQPAPLLDEDPAQRAGGGAEFSNAAIDINRADVSELQLLPGIGPAKAAAIVATRERMGAFRTVDDLLEVNGIGPATLERLRPYVHVGDVTGGGGEMASR